ncbi:hypothetical protein QU850_25135 [Escherichia coli]|nr:hypothetical protein [Escherichia coli]
MVDRMYVPPLASRRVKQTQIRSRDKWAETDLFVEQGVRYFFRVIGKWCDMNHCCDANGYTVDYPTITIRGQLSDNMVYTEKHIRII